MTDLPDSNPSDLEDTNPFLPCSPLNYIELDIIPNQEDHIGQKVRAELPYY